MRRAELAEVVGVNEYQLDKLVKKGVIVRTGRGEYDATTSLKNYIAFLRQGEMDDKADISTERARLAKVRREGIERRMQAEQKRLIPRSMASIIYAAQRVETISRFRALRVEGFNEYEHGKLQEELEQAMEGMTLTLQGISDGTPYWLEFRSDTV